MAERDHLVEQSQSSDGENPSLFLLSVKASESGLNLTAATHVFHFDGR
jgi:SNF2 family DNA or RNA helicase